MTRSVVAEMGEFSMREGGAQAAAGGEVNASASPEPGNSVAASKSSRVPRLATGPCLRYRERTRAVVS